MTINQNRQVNHQRKNPFRKYHQLKVKESNQLDQKGVVNNQKILIYN